MRAAVVALRVSAGVAVGLNSGSAKPIIGFAAGDCPPKPRNAFRLSTDGSTVIADDSYIRDCILIPEKRRVASYPPVMPSFAGQMSEEDLLRIIAYIKSLAPESPS